MPAVFHPDGDPDETLELGESETEMVEAIEKLRQVIERRRPKPGRLRIISFLTILTFFAGAQWLARCRHRSARASSLAQRQVRPA